MKKPAKKRAIVGIAVCNNVVASVKRRARLGITTGARKNARIPKGEKDGSILWRAEATAPNGTRREYRLHATKGYRSERIWA